MWYKVYDVYDSSQPCKNHYAISVIPAAANTLQNICNSKNFPLSVTIKNTTQDVKILKTNH